MIALDTAAVLEAVGGKARGPAGQVCGVSTDSRAVLPGSLFVALRGDRHDAHDFSAEAVAAGAAAILVERWQPVDTAQIRCTDSLEGLGRLAGYWRRRHQLPVVGITGSNGKTTVKSMLESILEPATDVLITQGNYNNELGLPLTLCRLGPQHRFAVLEMGAARPGDIAYLADIARPQIAVITNAGPAHLEGMGDIAGVARTKGELIEALPADGVAIINGDDEFSSAWSALAADRQLVRFGLEPANDVSAQWTATDAGLQMRLVSSAGEMDIGLNCHGQHNVYNALAAAAAALTLEVSLDRIRDGLERFTPVDGRLAERLMAGGWRLLVDTYNANPASVSAGLRVLAGFAGERWLVLGDMRELGPDSDALHFQVGAEARRLGIDRLFCLGTRTRHTAAGYGEPQAHFAGLQPLIEALRSALNPAVVCLIKGSRSMRMERVSNALEAG